MASQMRRRHRNRITRAGGALISWDAIPISVQLAKTKFLVKTACGDVPFDYLEVRVLALSLPRPVQHRRDQRGAMPELTASGIGNQIKEPEAVLPQHSQSDCDNLSRFRKRCQETHPGNPLQYCLIGRLLIARQTMEATVEIQPSVQGLFPQVAREGLQGVRTLQIELEH